jgi:hypothetical protein
LADEKRTADNMVLPKWGQTEVIEHFVRYWAFVPADGILLSISFKSQHLFINLASVTG